jgi:hypothetical protein
VVLVGASRAGVEVEPELRPAGATAEVGGEPTIAVDADTGAAAVVEVGT